MSASSNIPRKLDDIAVSENSFQKYLISDGSELRDGSRIVPRQVTKAHYVPVLPEKVPQPRLVAVSQACLRDLNIDPGEAKSEEFVQTFSGNSLISGMEVPYCTAYGTHSYGQWFGQMGDGRAVHLGETRVTKNDAEEFYSLGLRELQLKGSGRSPFSRGFDGRAVLRSSVREFLISEAMYHLRVPTTRALSLITTGQGIRRPWYASTSADNPYSNDPTSGQKFSPDVMLMEPGAVVCRVSRSFLRFGHLELFAQRKEMKELLQLADYVCLREYPHLLPRDVTDRLPEVLEKGEPTRYIQLLREISQKVAFLVAQWLRVGYVQGNMNSDNTLLGGVTMDYGPFGMMEKFDPYYQPFTSDSRGNFAFIRQPAAMGVNIAVLSEDTFVPLIKYVCKLSNIKDHEPYVNEIKQIAEREYGTYFTDSFNEVKRCKLGLRSFHTVADSADEKMWNELLALMYKSAVDYTIFFRELSKVHPDDAIEEAMEKLQFAFYPPAITGAVVDMQAWNQWMDTYLHRLQQDLVTSSATTTSSTAAGSSWSEEQRINLMNTHNPKFVLRNWMSTMAYEAAERGDNTLVNEVQAVLEHPYEEQSEEVSRKWYQKTPQWAVQLPGVAFYSCSS